MQIGAYALRVALVVVGAASLVACAGVPQPHYGISPAVSSAASVAPMTTGHAWDRPYVVGGVRYTPHEQPNYNMVGVASWYGEAYDGRRTSNGEIFDMTAVSGAHTTLPLPAMVEVTNLANGRKLVVRVNDRGPFVGNRIIDLSQEAARQLGYENSGLARVRVRYLGPAPAPGPEAVQRMAQAKARRAARSEYASASAGGAYRPRAAAEPEAGMETAQPYAASESAERASFTSSPSRRPRLDMLPAVPGASAARGRLYRVQIGAFSDEARARSVAARLAGVGAASVEPVQRGASTLYRVVLPGTVDMLQTYNLRQRAAEAGFAEAVVVGPS